METKLIDLQVGGMTCAACSSRVERGLKKLGGVSNVHVNLATERAVVEYDPATVAIGKFIEAVTTMGYTVKAEKVILPVGGMTCAACSARVSASVLAAMFSPSVTVAPISVSVRVSVLAAIPTL